MLVELARFYRPPPAHYNLRMTTSTPPQDRLKRAAARAAIDHLLPGEVVGVGSGSTVNFFIEELGARRDQFPTAVSSSSGSTGATW